MRRIMGVMGPMGLMGLMGPMGPMGPMGLMGPMGPRGLMGLRGPRRLRGLIALIGLMGLMGLMGCSSESTDAPAEEPTVETGTPIALSANQQPETVITRTGLDEKGVTAFTVFGYKNYGNDDNYATRQTVFPGYTVSWTANSANTSTTNTNSWEYVDENTEQTIKYWDWGASAYRFFGVTGGVNSGIGTGTQGTYGTYGPNGAYETYELTITADGSTTSTINTTPFFSHLWFSTGRLPDYPDRQFGKPVQLEFLKPLSTVRFMFTFENPDDATTTMLTDKSFRPTNGSIIKTKGNITISYPLTGPATEEWYTYNPGMGGITKFSQDYYEEGDLDTDIINDVEHVVKPYFDAFKDQLNTIYTVLPVSNQGSYTLSVSVNGDPKTTVVPAEFMDWKLGYLYTYIFKIHVDGSVKIETVQSAFTQWTTHSTTHTVYNW